MNKSLVKKILYISGVVFSLVGICLATISLFIKGDSGSNVWREMTDWNDSLDLLVRTYQALGMRVSKSNFISISSAYGMATYGTLAGMIISALCLVSSCFGIFLIFTNKDTQPWIDITFTIVTIVGFVLAMVGLITVSKVTNEKWIIDKIDTIVKKLTPA